MELINIAPLANISFSSISKYSKSDDAIEFLEARDNRDFSFHSILETNPFVLLQFSEPKLVNKIKLYNRKGYTNKSKNLSIDYSLDNLHFFSLLQSSEDWGDSLEIESNTDNNIKYIKLYLRDKQYFHLRRIEIFSSLISYSESDDSILDFRTLQLLYFFFYSLDQNLTMSSNSTTVYFRNIDKYDKIKYSFSKFNKKIQFKIEIQTPHLLINIFRITLIELSLRHHFSLQFNDNIISILISSNFDTYNLNDSQFCQKFYNLSSKIVFLSNIISKYSYVTNSYSTKQYNHFLIDSDSVSHVGFADRIRGILGLSNFFFKRNIPYSIKFTVPHQLNKFYNFEFTEEDKYQFKFIMNYADIACYPIIRNDLVNCLDILIDKLRFFYSNIAISTNIIIEDFDANTFSRNFKPTKYLNDLLQNYLKQLSNYASISFRFMNSLGDFNEPGSQPLPGKAQEALKQKCKSELIKYISNLGSLNILVLSDSKSFLDYISDIPRVFTFPEDIGHISTNSPVRITDKMFEKTILDFNLIMNAESIIRFNTQYLYPSGFPAIAAKCSGKEIIIHNF